MSETSGSAGRARAEYQALAPIYDEFNSENNYEMWLGRLLSELEPHGLTTGRLLDAGCGTGMAFEPMLRRGWEVVGCDWSPEMLELARRKHDGRVPLHEADVRELPVYGEFDLVWALNGVVQYLDDVCGLESALVGMRANLAPDGLILFDADTLLLLGDLYGRGHTASKGDGRWLWAGETDRVESEGAFVARISGDGTDPFEMRAHHFSRAQIQAALGASGLRPIAEIGHQEKDGEILLRTPPDEDRDIKVLYVARAT